MSQSPAIKERMIQLAIHFYLKLLCNKMFKHRILLLLMAVFVTLTNGYLLSSKLFSPTLPEPLKMDVFNKPGKPRPCMPHLCWRHLDRPHPGKPRPDRPCQGSPHLYRSNLCRFYPGRSHPDKPCPNRPTFNLA